ncbi:hypothetical protein [Puniceicoccus vermicola]|uniref:Verru_Chthon cassette protein A n=1 Tax=Puniceicoccus vermicola TaxID=388746 RepID=A0A7X1AZS6_9BACT|nr:hypothetical protein [Puniceicoccus vermicola]MBC2602799.1 hypothetical protein [Puniceicoccus vermicola]
MNPKLKATKRTGFALIISLSLMSFVLLILLSISTLVSVETSRSNDLILAEQNARLGATIALGELQKYTGPDQRTTALANIDANLLNTTDTSGHWVGSYRNGATADYQQVPSSAATAIIAASDRKGSQAKLTNWLISGNEGQGNTSATPTNLPFDPTDTVTNLTAATAFSTDITIANQPARLLVGPNTVGNAPIDYVAAPLKEISGSSPTNLGGYAWWVGDEGSKARVNLLMPTTLEDSANAFVTSPRAAIELMDADNMSDSTTLSDDDMLEKIISTSAYDPSDERLLRITTTEQLPRLSTAIADDAKISKMIGYRHHDISAYSEGIPTDTYAGGLKQDLSALLATGATTPLNTDRLFQVEANTGDSVDPDFGVPTWGQLRSFAQTTAGTELTPRLPTKTQSGISPVLTYLSLGFQYVVSPSGTDIHLAIFPTVTLWNPYTVPIAAARYEVGFQRRYSSKAWLQLQEADPTGDPNFPWIVKETRSLNRAGATRSGPGSTGSYDSYFRFVVETQTIGPGESIIYSLQGSENNKLFNAPANGEPQNVLTEGFNPAGHVLMPSISQKSPTSDGSTEYRVAINRSNGAADKTISADITYSYIDSTNMNQGEICAYLGEVVETEPIGFDPTTGDKRWYQSFTRAYSGTDPGYSSGSGLAQGPAPLSTATIPAFAQTFKAAFAKSSMRWLAQGNPRAFMVLRHPRDAEFNTGDGMDSTTPGYTASSTNNDWPQYIVGNNEDASSGYTLDANGAGETIQSTLFEFRPDTQPLLSVGQLQHANLGFANGHPAYAIGNSLADFRIKNEDDVLYLATPGGTVPTSLIKTYYDYSWNLNRAIWDRYFVSTVPHSGTGKSTDDANTVIPNQLPNPRISVNDGYTGDELKDATLSAKHLNIKGAFNINSTSEQAWRAILGGINKLAYDPIDKTASATRLQSALARFSNPTLAPNTDSDTWQGYRQLDEEQIAQLANNIVTEIRNRGPFISMADFINRRLVDNPDTQYPDGSQMDERLKGTLQAALDRTTSGALAANPDTALHLDDTPSYSGQFYNIDAMRGGPTSVAPYSSKSAFAPQYLTQADILSAIGSTLSARSDTFTIRSYGEVINPTTKAIDGRAWCEIVVQRTAEYVDNANPPETHPSLASNLNQTFGRKYKIVSLRWLTPEEI